MTRKNVLILCERSGTVREAFRRLGHNAYSCDLEPADDASPHHCQYDAFKALADRHWHLVIAHPPCTYLASSGLHWNHRNPERQQKTRDALEWTFRLVDLLDHHADAWAIENPVGCLSTHWRRPDQYVQPYEFGDDASKKTGLWLRDLPRLEANPDDYVQHP